MLALLFGKCGGTRKKWITTSFMTSALRKQLTGASASQKGPLQERLKAD
jgi:hypothetical protein